MTLRTERIRTSTRSAPSSMATKPRTSSPPTATPRTPSCAGPWFASSTTPQEAGRYTDLDAALLAEVDEAFGQLSGPAIPPALPLPHRDHRRQRPRPGALPAAGCHYSSRPARPRRTLPRHRPGPELRRMIPSAPTAHPPPTLQPQGSPAASLHSPQDFHTPSTAHLPRLRTSTLAFDASRVQAHVRVGKDSSLIGTVCRAASTLSLLERSTGKRRTCRMMVSFDMIPR